MTSMPIKGDIVVLDAEPHSGKEYGGHDANFVNIRRHYVVMSSTDYNQATEMVLAMPITTSDRYQNNQWYFPILINGSQNTGVKGYVVGWQLTNFDYKLRHGQIINHISDKTYTELKRYIQDMLDL
ncbi:hypothetical protein YK48G_10070 [Lentilactobacillus fungorum]|uniref:Type II toxin-antitoxin system PemK/MazF family toxin n=1 Tax=Lentilactobacillus fungorum TaxID=2201250 RepID=A0ABQ3VXD8_9LACO|nr:type II toxin-antitoxin system PemK/MazF family toxin [Lentilactobacillus fungorum]GHP13582.1 hypothetical protein YK48G_10070 [Lentilactobacillus fungorum]